MTVKAVIFDLDGTLINSIKDIANNMNEALKMYGFEGHTEGEYKYLVGIGASNLVRDALPEKSRNDDELIKKVHKTYTQLYDKNYLNNTYVYNGITELLRYLTGKGIKLAVLSNKPHEFTVRIIKELFKDFNFEVILGQQEALPKKPSPDGAMLIVKTLKIKPQDFIYMGDSAVDIKTAKAAGMVSVGVLWGFRSYGELINEGADYIIKKPADIIKIVES